MIKPCGHRVLIKPDDIEEKTKGGIYIPSSTVHQERQAQDKGTVLDIGLGCWVDMADGSPWCKVGDKVYYPRYSGMKVKDGEIELILVSDEDIVAVITES